MPASNFFKRLLQVSKFSNLLKNLKRPDWASGTRRWSPGFRSLLKDFERLPMELVRAIWEELAPILIVQSGREIALREGYLKEYHIVVLASGGTGAEYDPIFPSSFQKCDLVNGHWCFLDIFDTAGSELEWRHDYFIKYPDCILLLFSLTSRESFTTKLPYWVEEITRLRGMVSNGTPPPGDALPCPVVLVGTKSDDAENRCVSQEEAEAFAATLKVDYVECSAKLGQGVTKAVHQMVWTMLEHDKASGWKVSKNNGNPRLL